MNKKFTKLMAALALLAVFALPMRVWADSYVKVTSTDQLVAGDVYIIATSTAIATAYNNNNLTTVASGFTESSGTITTSTASPMEFTLGTSGSSYTLIMSDGKYLGYSGSGTTFRNTQTNANENKEKWTIAYNSTYSLYTIVNVNTTGRHIGVGNSVFKAYTSMTSNAPATLYKKVVSTDPSITVGANPPESIIVDYGEHSSYQYGDLTPLAVTYANLSISEASDFAVQFYDGNGANPNELNEGDEGYPAWVSSATVYKVGTDYKLGLWIEQNDGDERYAYLKVFALGDDYNLVYSDFVTITQTARPAPSIAVTPSSLTGFTYQHNAGPSAAQSFAASGSNLTANVTVSVPADGDFEICATTNGTYGSSLLLTQSEGTLASTNVYVRLKAGKDIAENYTGAVTLNSTGATNQTVSLSGSVTGYNVTYNGNNNTGGTAPTDETAYAYNQSVTVLGNGDLVKTGHTFGGWNTQADGSGTNYAAGETFNITANTTLYAKWTVNTHNVTLPTADTYGNYTMDKENPVAYGTEVTLTYTPAASYEAYAATWSVNDTPISGDKFNMPDEDVTVTVAVAEVHGTEANPYTVAEALAQIPNVNDTENGVYVSAIVSEIITAYSSQYHNISYNMSDDGETTGDQLLSYRGKGMNGNNLNSAYDIMAGDVVIVYGNLKNYNGTKEFLQDNYLTYIKPVIALNANSVGNLVSFSYIGNGPSAAQNFKVRGRNLTGNLVLTASEDYELCETSNGEYANSLSLSTTNNTEKTIYVRMKANLSAGTHNGTVTMTSADAVTKTVDLTGSVSYSITYPASYTNGGVATAPNTAEVGATVTIVTAPDAYYYPSAIDFSSTPAPENVTISGNNISFTMPAGNVVISSITFERYENVTVTYSVNGNTTTVAAATIETGTSTTLPTNVEDLVVNEVTYTFEGWTADESNITSTSILTGSYTPAGDVTLYAVFSITEESSLPAYVLVESNLDDWSGEYLIVYNNTYALNSHSGNTNANTFGTYKDISSHYSNKVIAYNSTTSAYRITAAATTNGYSLYDEGDDAYLGCTTATNSGLRWDTDFTESVDEWTLSVSNIVSVKQTGRAIRWNNASGQYRFATYTTSSQQSIQLFKKGTVSESVTKYYTLIKDITGAETMANVYASHILTVKNGGVLTVTGNESNCLPENLIIEDGGQLITDDVIEATIKKNIRKYTVAANDNTDPDNVVLSNGWYFISYPLNCDYTQGGDDPNGVTNLITTSTYDLYLFDPEANQYDQENGEEWVNYKAHTSDFKLITGHGYLYANAADVTLEFAGSVNYTDPENPGISLENGYNLVGNPYAYNAYPSMSYYKMNEAGTGIDATEYTTADAVPPCTGILVYDDEDNHQGLITFSKSAPASGGAKGGINLTLAETQRGAAKLDNAIVSFNEGSQLGKFYFGTQNANLYIPQGTEEYAIVSSNGQGTMPVNFRANEDGQYTITVNPENVEMNYLHLIDNMTGMDVDLLQTPSYTFNATTRDYESRFRLVFAANNEDGVSTGSTAFAFYSNGNWVINNAGEATLQVVDLMGRILSSETVNGSVSKTINATPGVYMLRLINGENVKVQKVVIE